MANENIPGSGPEDKPIHISQSVREVHGEIINRAIEAGAPISPRAAEPGAVSALEQRIFARERAKQALEQDPDNPVLKSQYETFNAEVESFMHKQGIDTASEQIDEDN